MSKDWFAPKRFGYGAGLPIAWQGWVVLGIFIAALAALGSLVPPVEQPVAFAAGVIAIAIGLTIVAHRRTRGGWRWRWGEDA